MPEAYRKRTRINIIRQTSLNNKLTNTVTHIKLLRVNTAVDENGEHKARFSDTTRVGAYS